MKKITRLFIFALAMSLLFGCAACGAPQTEPVSKDIQLTNDYVLVVAEDAAESTRQAAYCLQTVMDAKLKMNKLEIVADDPGSNAFVFTVDDTMAQGQYTLSIQGTSAYLRAHSPYALLYAAKQLRQAWLDGNKPMVTAELCTQLSGTLDMENAPFTYISQNILFKNIEGGNTVPERMPRFQQLMYEYQPDILAMQECSEDWLSFMNSTFRKTYTSSVSVCNVSNIGTTIFFRTDRYEILKAGMIWLSPTPNVPSSQFDDASGPRSCHWALVKDLFSQQTIFVANCHPDWNNDTARAKQVEVIFQELGDEFATYPSFLSGDFNSGPDGPIYARVVEELTDSRKSAPVDLSQVDHTYHGFGSSFSYIDYIFHTPQFQASKYTILSDFYSGYISDHYGILAEFSFTE